MPNSNIIMYITGEMALMLLLVCGFLLFHIKSLKKLIAKLEEKISALRKSMRSAKKAVEKAQSELATASVETEEPKSFLELLEAEIDETRDYHQSLNPDRDIVLDISPDAPLERQVASLRHAFLMAEKEARYATDGEKASWDVLQSKLQQVIEFGLIHRVGHLPC